MAMIQIDQSGTDLRPDVFDFGLYKASFLWVHVAIPVLSAPVDHSAVHTFQYIPATPTQYHNYTRIIQHTPTVSQLHWDNTIQHITQHTPTVLQLHWDNTTHSHSITTTLG